MGEHRHSLVMATWPPPQMDPSPQAGADGKGVRDMLVAIAEPRNGASARILVQCGFEPSDEFSEKQ